MKMFLLQGVSALLVLGGAGAANAMSCADIAKDGNHPSGLTINEAVATAASDEVPIAHCLVRGSTAQRKGLDGKNYSIRFELRLPDNWNGRFVHQFNGGNDGVVLPALGPFMGGNKKQTALSSGYAVVSSDAGHDGKAYAERGIAGGAAFGFDPQARSDYGYGAVAKLQPLARATVEQYYGKPVAFAYGMGSSNGGRHALVAASRTPNAFDGLLVGYPGFNLPKAAIQHAWDVQTFAGINQDIAKAFPREDMKTLADGILAACDAADGVKDGIVSDADACDAAFKPQVLQCAQQGDKNCLSAAQIAALTKIQGGPRNSKGEQLYSRWVWDPGMASGNWRGWKLESGNDSWGKKPIIGVQGAASLSQIFTTPPVKVGGTPDELQAFLLNYDFDKDAPKIFATDATFTESAAQFMIPPGSDNPDLKEFKEEGHKMIVFHGNADPVFSVVDTVNWYKKLDQNNGGKASDFSRLYRIPGMPHGAGGPSFDDFDFFSPLVAWVEQGKKPDAIVAGVTAGNKEAAGLAGSRYLYCPYPTVTKASANQSAQDENRYVCQ